jgi:probable HAF family extracellular repeat protein
MANLGVEPHNKLHIAFLDVKEFGLGTLDCDESRATDINNLGKVIGYSDIDSSSYHVFLWTKEEGMTDLITLDGGLTGVVYPGANFFFSTSCAEVSGSPV